MATLNTSVSAVDFLKGRGFQPQSGDPFPLYGQRKSIYEGLGLNSQLGNFRGASNQNTALLNLLRKKEQDMGVSLSPNNLLNFVQSQQATAPVPPTAPTVPTPTTPAPTAPTPVSQKTPQGYEQLPPDVQARVDSILNPLQGRDLAQEAINKFTGSATYPLQQEAVQAQKAEAQLTAQRDTEKFIKNIASRGLFFSGAKQQGVQAIDAEKLSNLLGIDRKFALLVAQGLESSAQDIAKEAQKGSQEALQSLKSLGFDLNPVTGRIEPTLAAKQAQATENRYQQTEQRLIESQRITEKGQALTQQRFKEGQAATQARFEATYNLQLKKFEQAIKKQRQDTGVPFNSKEYAQVKRIIASNPNEWGHAADEIDKQFGAGTATRYDALLKDVYLKGKRLTATDIDQATMADLINDIQKNANLGDLYNAYPEVSPSLIQSIYYGGT